MTPRAAELAGWTPIDVEIGPTVSKVKWCCLGSVRFTDPFFEQTIARAKRIPGARPVERETSLMALEAIGEASTQPRLNGFIFHMSRCGSTLLAQMLAALPSSIVISEAPPIDQVLTSHLRQPEATLEKRKTWLRGLIAGLTQTRFAPERHRFIKFDSWHIFELPLIRASFPDVPWIFLYRDPIEVMVSHMKLRGMQMIPGGIDPRLFGWSSSEVESLPIDVYSTRVLARICAAGFQQARTRGGHLVNFSQLPHEAPKIFRDVFGLTLSEEDLAAFQKVASVNAKNPVLPHEDDVALKQRQATPELRRRVAEALDGIYLELETLRCAQESGVWAQANHGPPPCSVKRGNRSVAHRRAAARVTTR